MQPLRQRFTRFRLRSLLLMVCLVAMLLSLWSNKANRQRRAVNVIHDYGHVVYWHEFPYRDLHDLKPGEARLVDYSARPVGSILLRRLLGDDYFQTVRLVSFSPTDEVMNVLSDLPEVNHVDLDGFRLTDEGFRKLATVTDLEDLSIENATNLSSDSMSILEQFKNLKTLTIKHTPIDSRFIKFIANSKSLRQVYLYGTQLTKEDEKRLRDMLSHATVDVEEPTEYDGGKPTGKPAIAPYNSYGSSSKNMREKQRRVSGL